MKKTACIYWGIILGLFLFSGVTDAQTAGQNYVLKKTYKSTSSSNTLDEINYYDGLGRLVETVQKKHTPGSKDLVTRYDYDNSGRLSKTWLPAPANQNSGNYTGSSTAASHYGDTYAYSETKYEASPLNRVSEEYGPGADWRGSNNRRVKTEYSANTSSGVLSCSYYYLESNQQFKKSGTYPANSLFVTKITDEDNNVSYEFKDKLGRIVLHRQIVSPANADTYYIYDDFGNLVFVLPPEASVRFSGNGISYKIFGSTTEDIAIVDMCYYYRYDERNRIKVKSTPGNNEELVYDKADRLVMRQTKDVPTVDKKRGWIFYKYDALGRLILSGIYHGDDNGTVTDVNLRAANMENRFKTVVSKESPSDGTYGYTWNTFPTSPAQVTVTQIYYYDDYPSALNISGAGLGYTAKSGYGTQYSSAKGLQTGVRYRQLDGTESWITTVYYYDANGNIIQEHSTNRLGGTDRRYYAYNYNNLRTKKYTEHKKTAQSAALKEEYSYEYDYALRPANTRYSIDGKKFISNMIDTLSV